MSAGPVRRLFRLFERPPSPSEAVDLEIEHHIEERAEELMAREGLTRDAAMAEARRRFGDIRRFRRELESGERQYRREVRRRETSGQTRSDVRFAMRTLRRNPGLTAIVMLTLTLGIGLNVAIFSVVKGVLLDPLPYPDADRLVWGYGSFSGSPQAAVSPPDYLDYREQATSFEYLGARRGIGSYTATGLDRPEVLRGQEVTAGFFEALGGVPVIGRGFDRSDERSVSRVIVLGYTFWQRRFGGRADVLGETLTIDGESYEIVGAMPPGFRLFSEPDFWLPIPLHAGGNLVRRFHNLRLVGKLRTGVTIEAAQAELDVIAARLERRYPESNATWRLPIIPLRQVFVGGVETPLYVLWGAVGLLLLIVCANVANLLLARGAGRKTELAVRAALGASRGRIVRLLLTESALLTGVGCAAGVALSIVLVRALVAVDPGLVPRIDEVVLDGGVLGFAVGISVLTGLVFGLLPSFASSRVDPGRSLKAGGRGADRTAGRTRGALVVAEVALSFILLMGAGLLLQSFSRLLAVDPGFEAEGLAIASVSLPSARYETAEERIAFFSDLRDRLEALPGVERAATGSNLPLTGGGNDTYVGVPGRLELGTDEQFNSQFRTVSEEFFEVLGIPLLRGRSFDDSDRAGSAPVVVINQPFADAIFPDQNPVGQRIHIDLGELHEAEIIGVVGAVSHYSLTAPPILHLYLPYEQVPRASLDVVVRTSIDPSTVLDGIPAAVEAIDPMQAVARLSTYEDVVSRGMAQPRFQTLLLAVFAGVALTLALVGVYGVLSYFVAQRSGEVGIRMALGARRRDVIELVLRRGLGLTLMGMAIGVVGAFVLTRYLTSLLYQVSATDVLTFAGVAALLGTASFAASYLPAARAARVDPTVTLRGE